MQGLLTFVGVVFAICIVVAVVGAVSGVKRQMKAMGKIQNSPKFKAITEHIFRDGRRPSRIVVTFQSEIFYGPFENRFLQVPGDMVPSMNKTERHALGGAFEKEYGYSYHLCNSGSKTGIGTATADTGNEYIDTHAEFVLISEGGTGGSW